MESVGKVENMLACANHTVAVVGIARLHHSASLARRLSWAHYHYGLCIES